MSDTRHKIFIIRATGGASKPETKERRLEALRLRHPRTGGATGFLLDSDSKDMLQIEICDNSPRSWLVGSAVETDGQMHVCTPFDPLFVVLSYMQKSQYAEQLEQLLTDSEFPDARRLTELVDSRRLALIAESKGDAELQAFKYSEERTLAWLERKTRRLAALLETKRLHGTSGQAASFVKVARQDAGHEAYLEFACGITSDCLSGALGTALRRRLQLPERKARSQPSDEGDRLARKRPRAQLTPLEDYGQPTPLGQKDATPQNAKQKALAKSAVGTKSITSFFKKK
ncbi:ribonuclease H2 subunit B-like isoform X2 [Pollicipes pollicipes]|uniref:ribonuclease H2 subunit B-like isoform X1 n=1 Tax=Pollicipes pollicipes TaxID=41117 RepID=UPI00188563E5|nr:ribonuclease H2 subunit B-like isoform X1 [Pollicipes pollicipes]XP_037090309.1 ribonuclease H2 subunit B-like isoform X2 [Pollicipes pollicipes]